MRTVRSSRLREFSIGCKWLSSEHEDKRPLWDTRLAKRTWGGYQATDKQKNIIRRRYPDMDVEGLTKFQASQLLTRVFNG